jgi:hypothetical protein
VQKTLSISCTSASYAYNIGSSDAGDSSGATTDCDEPSETMAMSPTLTVDDTTRGRHRDVAICAAGRQMIRIDEVQLLSPQHHLLKSKKEQEKREQYKSIYNAMLIPRGHQQEGPRVELHRRGLWTPGAHRGWHGHRGHNNFDGRRGQWDLQNPK